MTLSSPVEKIKERLTIVDVVSSYITLEKSGANYRARCPFHNEKTPSFFVSPVRDTYHCFGCHKGGDIFSFVEEMEGLDFRGALKVLSDRAGVSLSDNTSSSKDDNKEILFKILEEAALYYQINLTKHKEALSYLYGRGLKRDTLKNFRIGFALDVWDGLYVHLTSKNYKPEDAVRAGLLIEKEESHGRGYYDRFRGRIMFPIMDSAGRICGFSGRIFGSEDESQSKYVNTPETVLYNKSKILYGYEKAKLAIRKEDASLIVEGQFDLILSHQAGLSHTVAVSGTALTYEHLRLIKRLGNTLILAFDADSAGLRASEKSAQLALSLGMDVKSVTLPPGIDPADIIKENEHEWKKRVTEAKHIVHYYLDFILSQDIDERERLKNVRSHLLPLVKHIGDKIDQSYFIKEVAQRLILSEEAVKEELAKIPLDVDIIHEETEKEEFIEKAGNVEGRIFGLILSLRGQKPPISNIEEKEHRMEELLGKERVQFLHTLPSEEKNKLVFEAEALVSKDKIENEFQELFQRLEHDLLKEQLKQKQRELRIAEDRKEEATIRKILEECSVLSKDIERLKNN